MIDPLAAFIALLLSNSALNTLVGGRVRGSPPGLNKVDYDVSTGRPKRSLAVQHVDAGVQRSLPILMPMFYLVAYGASANDASDVIRAVYPVLYDDTGRMICNRMIDDNWFLYWANLETGPSPNIEPQSNWPVAYATVRAKFDAMRGA